MNRIALFSVLLLLPFIACSQALEPSQVDVPLMGNTYTTTFPDDYNFYARRAPAWNNVDEVKSTFIYFKNTGALDLVLKGCESEGGSIKITVEGKEFVVNIPAGKSEQIQVGRANVSNKGYLRIDMQGVERTGEEFAKIQSIEVSGPAISDGVIYVGDGWQYWGMRGPSVHMKYTMPQDKDVRYFYNEVTVPQGNDVLASYFMSNGFDGGYMGMQVNSPSERRILFSVWSPYETDNPAEIPEEFQVKSLRRGDGVKIGEFGNEGSGGQSYLIYPWEAGNTYKYLTEVRPDGQGNTIFTGYFCGHDGKWRLIASFLRPKTDIHYQGAHSFLENFSPMMGYETREVYFDNQWVYTVDGQWIELTEGTFTYDNTARNNVRLDYQGGLKDGKFYLKNCGFFNENTEFRSVYTRPAKGQKPEVDFKALELL